MNKVCCLICRRKLTTSSELPKAAEVNKIVKQYPLFSPSTEPSAVIDQGQPKPLPSVTRILEATRSPEDVRKLKEWEKRKIYQLGGVPQFKAYKQNMMDFSKKVHSSIREYATSGAEHSFEDPKLARVFENFSSLSKKSIKSFHMPETMVAHPDLKYRGIVDCVIEVEGLLLAVDWKVPTEPLRRRMSLGDCQTSELMQAVAYMGAINRTAPHPLPRPLDGFGLVYLYSNEFPADAHTVVGRQCLPYWAKWVQRLQMFHQSQSEAIGQ